MTDESRPRSDDEPREDLQDETAEGVVDGEAEGTEFRRRRRRGCLLRFPLYGLLGLVALGAGLFFWARSDSALAAARRMAEARLSEYFDRDVSVGQVRWTLAPLSVEVEDLVIPSPPGTGDGVGEPPPFARVPVVRLQLRVENWANWRRPVLHVEEVFVESPEVVLVLSEDGTDNLPEFGRQRREGRKRVDVRLGSIVVEDGLFVLNELRVPVDLTARDVVARLTGEEPTDGSAGVVLDGRVNAQEVRVTLPGGQPYTAAVSARTRISAQAVEIQELLLRGPDAVVRSRGELVLPSEERRLDLSVAAEGGVALASHLGYLDQDRVPLSGPFRFDGSFFWRPEGWSVEGILDSDRLVYDRRVVTDVEGFLRVMPDVLRYSMGRASYAGGRLAGVVQGEIAGKPRPFTVDLSLEGLNLETVVADQGLELEGIHGQIGGEVSYRFDDDDPVAGSGWADLSVESAYRPAAAGAPPEGLALTGSVPIEIDRGTVRLSGARLSSRSGDQLLDLEGAYELESGEGRFEYRLSTRDVGPLAALVPLAPAAAGGPIGGEGTAEAEPVAWLPTAGVGDASGVFQLSPGTYSVTAVFDLTAVEAPGLAADLVTGSVLLTPEGLRDLLIQAARGDGAVIVAGTVPFGVEGAAEPSPPFHLTVEAASWPVDRKLAAWVPVEIPLEGALSGHLELGEDLGVAVAGEPASLVVAAELSVEPAAVAGVELDLLLADFRLDSERLWVDRLVGRSGAGTATARGSLALDAGELDFQVEAPRLELSGEPLASFLQGDLSGLVAVGVVVGGTLESPVLGATVEGSGLEVAGRRLGDDGTASVDLTWRGDRLTATGGVPGVLQLEGGGPLTTERAELAVRLTSARLGEAIRALVPGAPSDLEGALSGELEITGELARPEELLVRFQADTLSLAYEERTVRNLEPVVVRFTGDAIELDSLFVEEVDSGSELFVQGSVGLGEETPLDLRTQGSLATDWLELLVPDVEIDGTFDVLATVGGTLRAPKVNGQGEIRQGHVILPDFPQSFEDLNAVVLFYPDQVVLDRLEADVGGGEVRAFGRLALYGTEGLDYRLQATVDDVTLRYPEGFWFESDAALTLSPTPDGREVRGTVTLGRAFYVRDVETGLLQILRQALRAERLEVAETNEIAASTQLAIAVQAPGTVRVRNNLADLHGSADLTVRGTAARPVVFGTVELDPGGTLVYEDNEFEVERARLTFANPARIEPVVDLVATAEVREYDLTLDLSGKIDNLQVRLASDPPLSDLDVVSLLATGQAPQRTGAVVAGGATQQAFSPSSFLAGQAASAVTERVGTLFGFDKFRITPAESETGNALSGVGVTVGKRLSKDVVVTFTELSGGTQGSLLQVEWQVDDNLTLVFSATEENGYRVDARWSRRF